MNSFILPTVTNSTPWYGRYVGIMNPTVDYPLLNCLFLSNVVKVLQISTDHIITISQHSIFPYCATSGCRILEPMFTNVSRRADVMEENHCAGVNPIMIGFPEDKESIQEDWNNLECWLLLFGEYPRSPTVHLGVLWFL